MPPDSAVAETPPAEKQKTAQQLMDELVARTKEEVTKQLAAETAAKAAALDAETKKSLDAKNVDGAEKLSKQFEELSAKLTSNFEERMSRYQVPGLEAKDAEKFSFAKLITGMATKNFANCQYEVELCREAAITVGKDMSTTVDSAGGFIVPVQVMASKMIPLLQAKIIAFELGVQELSGLSGSPVQIPKITGGTTAVWIGENTAPTTSQPTFGQLEMTPHLVAAMSVMSLRLANLSSPAAEKIVLNQLSKDISLAIDAAIFNGTGAGNQPTGALQTIGIQTQAAFGSAMADTAYNALIDMVTKLITANASSPSSGWAIDPLTWSKLNKQTDQAGTIQPKQRRLFDSMPISDSLLGFKHRESTMLPANTIAFADWSQVVLGRWGTMILRSSQEGTFFEKFQVGVQAGVEVDVGVMQPSAIVSALGVS